MRQLLQPFQQRTPVAYSIRSNPHQVYVRSRAYKAFLQIPSHSIGDCQRNNQRSHACRHANHRNRGNHSHHSLPPLRPQIPRRNKKFKSHRLLPHLANDQICWDYLCESRDTSSHHRLHSHHIVVAVIYPYSQHMLLCICQRLRRYRHWNGEVIPFR